MKKIMISLLLFISHYGFAQQNTDLNKMEKFLGKKSRLIERKIFPSGRIISNGLINLPIQVLKIKDFRENDSIYVVQISSGKDDIYTIDGDELGAVISFFEFANNNYIQGSEVSQYTEIKYTCESGTTISIFNSKSEWVISLSKNFSIASTFLPKSSFPSIINSLKQANEMIASKK